MSVGFPEKPGARRLDENRHHDPGQGDDHASRDKPRLNKLGKVRSQRWRKNRPHERAHEPDRRPGQQEPFSSAAA